jgi:hypothetical protein
MDMTQIRPTWLTALLPLLAVYQYGDREIVRAELFRMALSADARRRPPTRCTASPTCLTGTVMRSTCTAKSFG